MAIVFDMDKNMLIIHVPNSEASVNAQHNGIKDTSVGSYYMSEQQNKVFSFLNNFDGEFYIDLPLVLKNSRKIIDNLKEKRLAGAFKKKLIPQESALEVLEWLIANEGPLYKMPTPTVNENNKYLKLDNLDNTVDSFRTLVLGELCDICFQRIGINGYLVYLRETNSYSNIVEEKAYKWVIIDD